jgi:hypothetical protein
LTNRKHGHVMKKEAESGGCPLLKKKKEKKKGAITIF